MLLLSVVVTLTVAAPPTCPAASPDGTQLVCVTDHMRLYRLDFAKGEPRIVIDRRVKRIPKTLDARFIATLSAGVKAPADLTSTDGRAVLAARRAGAQITWTARRPGNVESVREVRWSDTGAAGVFWLPAVQTFVILGRRVAFLTPPL